MELYSLNYKHYVRIRRGSVIISVRERKFHANFTFWERKFPGTKVSREESSRGRKFYLWTRVRKFHESLTLRSFCSKLNRVDRRFFFSIQCKYSMLYNACAIKWLTNSDSVWNHCYIRCHIDNITDGKTFRRTCKTRNCRLSALSQKYQKIVAVDSVQYSLNVLVRCRIPPATSSRSAAMCTSTYLETSPIRHCCNKD